MIHTGFRMLRDVSPHPNPRRANTKWQDNKLGTLEVIVTGYFKNHDSTLGPGQFYDWQTEDAANASLPFGRFGLRLDDFANNKLDLVPTATKGYILVDIEVNDAESPRDEASFVARLYRNGTP